jgi:hypothetical protein
MFSKTIYFEPNAAIAHAYSGIVHAMNFTQGIDFRYAIHSNNYNWNK